MASFAFSSSLSDPIPMNEWMNNDDDDKNNNSGNKNNLHH